MKNVFKNKTVLITGNTGFKGSWLSIWLLKLGANIVGLSDKVPTSPSNYKASSLEDRINQQWLDIRDFNLVNEVFIKFKPDFVFHLAAQPLVRRSYDDPMETFETNISGTLNILECLRLSKHKTIAVMITSDKCYDNVEQLWGYRENDRLGGKDPYSASKGAAELLIKSYYESYFVKEDSLITIGVGRAGNVIGGGDWALDRIIPDSARAWSKGKPVIIRNPHATRPWQHVLEPLSGYLTLASLLYKNSKINGEAFNFGPSADQNFSVANLLDKMIDNWNEGSWKDVSQKDKVYEAGLLKLCCDKALHMLNWEAALSFNETVKLTAEWYKIYYNKLEADIWALNIEQIEYFEKKIKYIHESSK